MNHPAESVGVTQSASDEAPFRATVDLFPTDFLRGANVVLSSYHRRFPPAPSASSYAVRAGTAQPGPSLHGRMRHDE